MDCISKINEDYFLNEILGKELLTVSFVCDYLELDFGGPILRLYILPECRIAEKKLNSSEEGWRDALFDLIHHKARSAVIEKGEKCRVVFDNGVVLEAADDDFQYEKFGYHSEKDPVGSSLFL